MKLIVGLGNPGRIYTHNRHNIGFMCVNHFAKAQGIRFDKKQGQARIGTGESAGNKLILARPQTGMNLSGQSVSRLVRKFYISLNDLLVINDDLDLPLGKIRISQGSGAGGHKGVDSIITHLGSADFLRIRIGIGRPATVEASDKYKEAEIINYVLSDFTPEEKKIIAQVISEVSQAILHLLTEGLTAAMNRYN
jgi:PTH1 family peptidyl-tRNA hydrolase